MITEQRILKRYDKESRVSPSRPDTGKPTVGTEDVRPMKFTWGGEKSPPVIVGQVTRSIISYRHAHGGITGNVLSCNHTHTIVYVLFQAPPTTSTYRPQTSGSRPPTSDRPQIPPDSSKHRPTSAGSGNKVSPAPNTSQ